MTDPIAATPGWVSTKLDTIFARLPEGTGAARAAFEECLAGSKAPAAPSDMLGAEFAGCHRQLRQALRPMVELTQLDSVMGELEALEAEIGAQS